LEQGNITEQVFVDITNADMQTLSYSVGFDIDPDAIKIAQENCETFEVDMDFVNTDLSVATLDGFRGKLDTIIMNPPFGTKNNKGVDMVLLKKAVEVYCTLCVCVCMYFKVIY
jgi:predicted RNA methylase